MLRKNLSWLIWGLLLLDIFFVFVMASAQFLDSNRDKVVLPITSIWLLASLVVAMAVLVCVVSIGLDLREDGEPLSNIKAGSYTIDFMKAIDKEIRVIILKKSEGLETKGESEPFFYQFPVKAFNGEIILDANTLEVTVSGHRGQFKKLHLVKTSPNANDRQEIGGEGKRIGHWTT